jgi:ribose/xylose/arabinose/galactoside ABC-type transport system permease subunit
MPAVSHSLMTPEPAAPWKQRLGGVLRPWLTLALVCALFSLHPDFRRIFWTASNLPDVLQQSARNVVLAVGMSFVILTGGIDLSIGSVLALSGVGLALALSGKPVLPGWLAFLAVSPVAALVGWLAVRSRQAERAFLFTIGSLNPQTVMGLVVALLVEIVVGLLLSKAVGAGLKVEGAIAVGLLVGMGCGLVNGLIVSVGRVPPFVATLGMLTAARGLTLTATDGSSIATPYPRLLALGQGVPLVLITLVMVLLGSWLLTRTRPGRYILSIGGNEQASRLSGVDVGANKTLAYVLAGLAAGVGALLVTARFGLASTNAGTGAELDAIAAVVIGGTSLSGGRGSIVGALVGALTITVITMGLVLVHVKNDLQPVILGVVIVLTVFLDNMRRR